MIEVLLTHFKRIRTKSHDDRMRIAFSVGIDATIVVQAYQYFKEAHAIVGGAHPSHFIDVSDKTKDEVSEMLDNCIHGKHGAMAAGSCIFFSGNRPVLQLEQWKLHNKMSLIWKSKKIQGLANGSGF